jgi:hypothetical protein
MTVLCAWCSKPATTEIEVQPAVYGSKKVWDKDEGKMVPFRYLKSRAIKAPACDAHLDIVDRQEPIPIGRSRKAHPQQSSIFEEGIVRGRGM